MTEHRRKYLRHWQNEHNKRLRSEWLKKNGPCVDCGSWDRLEVEHTDPTTKVDHKVWTWALTRREAELAKCQPRCKPCHSKKTGRERIAKKFAMHGTMLCYRRGCRCSLCSAVQIKRVQDWKSKTNYRGSNGLKAMTPLS